MYSYTYQSILLTGQTQNTKHKQWVTMARTQNMEYSTGARIRRNTNTTDNDKETHTHTKTNTQNKHRNDKSKRIEY